MGMHLQRSGYTTRHGALPSMGSSPASYGRWLRYGQFQRQRRHEQSDTEVVATTGSKYDARRQAYVRRCRFPRRGQVRCTVRIRRCAEYGRPESKPRRLYAGASRDGVGGQSGVSRRAVSRQRFCTILDSAADVLHACLGLRMSSCCILDFYCAICVAFTFVCAFLHYCLRRGTVSLVIGSLVMDYPCSGAKSGDGISFRMRARVSQGSALLSDPWAGIRHKPVQVFPASPLSCRPTTTSTNSRSCFLPLVAPFEMWTALVVSFACAMMSVAAQSLANVTILMNDPRVSYLQGGNPTK